MTNSIQSVITQALCSACGGCAAACPAKAISMRENAGGFLTATVDSERCIDCGKCRKICPSVPKNQTIQDLPANLHGPCLEGFIGHACKKSVRYEGQSGGLVTALLLYLLDFGKIDGAITNRFDSEKRRPKAVYANTRKELLDSSGSYYTQSAVVKAVLEHSGQRLAAVVLGCQAESLELFQKTTDKQIRPEYLLGLICAGQNSGHMIDKLIARSECSAEEVPLKFRFRYTHPAYGGWPGNVLVVTDSRRYTLNRRERFALKPICESYRCLLCYDQMCGNADLVCGDPWGIEGDHSAGETVVIARTEKGLQLLRDASEAGYIELCPLPAEKILAGETVDTRHKTKVAAGFLTCQAEGWGYPYTLSPPVAEQLAGVPKKELASFLPRLHYSRARFLADSPDTVAALTASYQRELDRAAARLRYKQRLLFPLRCIRYVIRKLGN